MAAMACLLGACAYMPQLNLPPKAPAQPAAAAQPETLAPVHERPEVLWGVTDNNQLIGFNAGTPGEVLSKPLQGLKPGEQVLGIDFRVARNQLFGLSSLGRLLRIDTGSATATAVSQGIALPQGAEIGFDVNPVVDRLRVVTDTGQNLRLHPDTGAQVAGDPGRDGIQADGPLAYRPGDLLAGTPPRIVAAAYTYNKANDKLTTNYAIDAGVGYLVVQGSTENTVPAVSPNTGMLQAIGPLGIERFDRAAFDISDVNNTAYLVTTRQGARQSRLYEVNLGSGQARLIGAIGIDQPVRGMAIEP